MRHSHISLLSQLGVSLRAIMERVGHTDHKTTLQIYSHVTEQMDKDMMNKLEDKELKLCIKNPKTTDDYLFFYT